MPFIWKILTNFSMTKLYIMIIKLSNKGAQEWGAQNYWKGGKGRKMMKWYPALSPSAFNSKANRVPNETTLWTTGWDEILWTILSPHNWKCTTKIRSNEYW